MKKIQTSIPKTSVVFFHLKMKKENLSEYALAQKAILVFIEPKEKGLLRKLVDDFLRDYSRLP